MVLAEVDIQKNPSFLSFYLFLCCKFFCLQKSYIELEDYMGALYRIRGKTDVAKLQSTHKYHLRNILGCRVLMCFDIISFLCHPVFYFMNFIMSYCI